MDQDRSQPEDKQPARFPLLGALLSGVVFGAIGAAAINWLAARTMPRAGHKSGACANWLTIVGGVFSGLVAFYSARRTPDAPPNTVMSKTIGLLPQMPQQPTLPGVPSPMIAAEQAERESLLERQSHNLGL